MYSEMHTGKWWWKLQVGFVSSTEMHIIDED